MPPKSARHRSTPPKSKAKDKKWLAHYLEDSRRWDIAVLMTAPLFALYELCLLVLTRGEIRNAADVRLKEWMLFLHPQVPLVVNTLLLLGFIGAALWREKRPHVSWLTPVMLLESALWALILGPFTLLLMKGMPLLATAMGKGPVLEVAFGVGAGLYEEVLFRLMIVGGLSWILTRFGKFPAWFALGAPVVFGAVLFAMFHHVGPLGDPIEPRLVAFRILAGLMLGTIYVTRGITVAIWTHALYDVLLALG